MEDISFSTKSMFWGVVLKPEKRYEQKVEDPFHISKACLEPSNLKDGKNAVTSVYIEVDDEEFLLCNLSDKTMNETLDLNFNVGDSIVFKTAGTGTVHLTGYNVFEDDELPSDDDDYEDEESTDESVDEAPQLVNGKKRKNNESLSEIPAKKKDVKMTPLDKVVAAQKAKSGDKNAEVKKAEEMQKKIAQAMAKQADDEDDSDDESGEEEESEDDSNDLVNDEAEEDDDESGEEEEEDEDDEEDDESGDDEEMETDVSPKKQMNGSPKKQMNGDTKKSKSPEKAVVKTEAKSPEKPDTEQKKKKKNKKKNKNKENLNTTTEAGDAKTPSKDQKKAKEGQKTPGKEQKTPGKEQKTPGKDQKPKTPGKTPKRTLKGGIQVEDLKEGNGPEAKRGKMVGMYYEGKLQKNGKTFDKNFGGKPFKFRLGAGEVIKGWDVGLDGIKVGGKRRLTIPANMAYGSQGAGSDIPPNATLVFDVECKGVN